MNSIRVSALARNRILLSPDPGWALLSSALNPSRYQVKTLGGTVLPIASTKAVGNNVELTLSADMRFNEATQVIFQPSLLLSGNVPPVPSVGEVTWTYRPRKTVVAVASFTGPITSGPLQAPMGQVFFGPAVQTATAGSQMSVDSVAMCVINEDRYAFPVFVDPVPLTLWSPVGWTGGTLNSPDFTAAGGSRFRSVEAVFDFGLKLTDTLATSADGKLTVTLDELYDPDRVSLLNNPHWTLWGTGMVTPFICADNTTSIPAGATTVISLVS